VENKKIILLDYNVYFREALKRILEEN